MSWSVTRKQAEAVAKKHCPKGWHYDLWNNLGWCVAWWYGPVSVYYEFHDGTFFGHLASVDPRNVDWKGHRAGADPDWCKAGGTTGKTVLEAARKAIGLFRASVARRKAVWARIELEVRQIPGV